MNCGSVLQVLHQQPIGLLVEAIAIQKFQLDIQFYQGISIPMLIAMITTGVVITRHVHSTSSLIEFLKHINGKYWLLWLFFIG